MQQSKNLTYNSVKIILQKISKTISSNIQQLTKIILKTLQAAFTNNIDMITQQNYTNYLNKYLKYKKIITPKQLCAQILYKDQQAIKCLQCQAQQNSILCLQCFSKSNHKGHNFKKIKVNGGCCDCGDDQKWDPQGFCTDHINQTIHYQINPSQTKMFIRQLKFLLCFIFMIENCRKQCTLFSKFSSTLIQSILTYLLEFNLDSLVSNQMTFQFFKQNFKNQLSSLKQNGISISLPIEITIQLLLLFYKNEQISKKLTNLCILLFPLKGFKKYIGKFYNNQLIKKPQLYSSQLCGLSCQIFTSYKIIKQLLQQQKLIPIQIKQQIKKPQKYQFIISIYSRYYIDLQYLCKLQQGVNFIYVDFHLRKGNVTRISGYQLYTNQFLQEALAYYGIQYYMLSTLVNFIKIVNTHKSTLKKSIQDLINYINNQPTNQCIKFYISKHRSLYLFLVLLCDGKIQQITTKQFLNSINLNYETIYKMLQSVLHVIRFDALNITNWKTSSKYPTYYYFTFLKPQIILSIDFQLLKFCIIALNNLDKQPISYQNPQINQSIGIGVLYQQDLTFENNAMPLNNLISLPTKFIQHYTQNLQNTEDGIYDRKKALGLLTGYIGLLHQMILFNHSQINIKKLFNFIQNKQLYNIYGQLLKYFQNVKFQNYKNFCENFIFDSQNILQQFIKQFCIIQNKKIQLKPNKNSSFSSLNLAYLKSKIPLKMQQSLIKSKQISFDSIPTSYLSPNIKQTLINTFFNSYFIKKILAVVEHYLKIFKLHQDILHSDLPSFSQFIQQLIKLNYTLKNPQIKKSLQPILKQQIIFNKFSQKLKKQLQKIQGITQQQPKKQPQQKVQKNIKSNKKKIQQLKNKQTNFLKKYQKQLPIQDNNINNQQHYRCMFCKFSHQQQPLYILCFQQKSNLFSTLYFHSRYSTSFVTSCGHFAHLSCISTHQTKQCNFCKTSFNSLLKSIPPQQSSNYQYHHSIQSQNDDGLFKKLNITKPTITILDIAMYILYGVIVDYDFFCKSLSSVCCYALNSLPNSEFKNTQKYFNLQKQINQSKLFNAYKFIIKAIGSLFIVSLNNCNYFTNKVFQQQSIGQQLSNKIITIFKSITKPQNLQNLTKTKLTPFQLPTLKTLPQNLQTLSKQGQICPQCKKITNQISLCLLCTFKSCVKCSVINLTKHAQLQHLGSCIFIRTDQGLPYYITTDQCAIYPGIYKNYIGQVYSLKKAKVKAEFLLNETDYNKVKTDLIRHRIKQQICYSKLMNDKLVQITNFTP